MNSVVQILIRAVPSIVLAAVLALPVLAGSDQRINKDANNVAIEGYDTVAYFTEQRPIKGKEQYRHVWQDAEWRFASAKHRDKFAADPDRYAPRYGGFCAGGMALGVVYKVDPSAWVIVEGKLYLNYSEQYAEEFVEDGETNIAVADANWRMLGKVE